MADKTKKELEDMEAILTNRLEETRFIIDFFEDMEQIEYSSNFDDNLSSLKESIDFIKEEIDSK